MEAPGKDFDKDKDYQLQRALDVLRAGGDLTRLAAAPENVVVTPPGSKPVETAETETPTVTMTPAPTDRPVRGPEITPGNTPKKD